MSMPSVSERRRVREVRKYYVRPETEAPITGSSVEAAILGIESTVVSSPNTTLTALVQLIAWRLGMQRAIISVVDENAQYFLAESTKTLNLSDSSQYEIGDGLWKGCGDTVRSEALCANTIELQPGDDKYACFCVEDLSKDERFCRLPYVVGAPNFRYYAGTPLITRLGIPIGSVFVIDDRPRGPPTKFEVEFLGVMARNVMEYLEMRKENKSRERVDIMSKGLAALVDGKSEIPSLGLESTGFAQASSSSQTQERSLHNELGLGEARSTFAVRPQIPPSKYVPTNRLPRNSEDSSSSDTYLLKVLPKLGVEEDDPGGEHLFSRASNVLRESLDVSYTVFFDVRVGNSTPSDDMLPTPVVHKTRDPESQTSTATVIRPSEGLLTLPTPEQQWGDATATASTTSGRQASRLNLANVLSFSTENSPFPLSHQSPGASRPFHAPEQRRLRRLIRHYPTGKLWTFNNHGAESTEDEDPFNSSPPSSPFTHSSSSRVRRGEVELLMSCFPGVKQVLFTPIWDVGKASHMAACFAVSLRPGPVFPTETETAYSRAFMNSITVACSLASSKKANKQKGDFISSISHELRSPLHGVMASVELLAGSTLDKQQKEFCDTIATCGQVLLETISDILEYTKINSLRKDARGLTRTSRRNSQEILPGVYINEESTYLKMMVEEPTTLISDIALLCEDAVGVVAAAHNLSTLNAEEHLHRIYLLPGATTIIDGLVTKTRKGSVPVILDISQTDWGFVCLSGAFQRIVMNLVGNSLKFTKSGFIQIHLSIKPASDEDENGHQQDIAKRVIILEVSDSGRGISSGFLKNKLFSAFSQESILAPGTGLGLHIVKNLVQMHDGTVHVKSQVGQGTTVTVTLPLLKPIHGSTPKSPKHQMAASESGKLSAYVSNVRNSLKVGTFAIHGFTSNASGLTRDSLERYLTQWFEMSPVLTNDGAQAPEIIIIDEEGFSDYLIQPGGVSAIFQLFKARLIVVCDPTRQPQLFQHISKSEIVAEILTTPFGPHKLSRVLLASLQAPIPIPAYNVAETIVNAEDAELSEAISSLPIPSTPEPHDLQPPELPLDTISKPHPLPLRPHVSSLVSANSNPLRILCVDDNPINLRLLKTFLEKLHYTDITCATDGSTAFDAVRQRVEGFELIFMDLSMPIIDGFSCMRMIRGLEKLLQRFSKLPTTPDEISSQSRGVKKAFIVALTGLASQKDQDSAWDAGANHFITKPLRLVRLQRLLGEWGFAGVNR